ncbi:dihydrofolate reductase family protein [Alkalihalobacillus hemicellulosilyticus]|uniref:Dihydrofolate reductase n=1 Tax=Halalkalibacter hemicellulosilyticusJCM 9152 TaxID=1236971 RepID=W4QF18_9BACI|nr:dihydrofolate reductase family protein [Halalkalibacter hemicellulosilyticus]GAE30258.1 dihydrofolate reductase [Halalkalibacter hemicellulosilyticusJCM 9152]
MIERKVIYSQMVSLDGYIEGPQHEIDWGKPGEQLFRHFNEQEKVFDTHLYGRKTYENMRDYWSERGQARDASKDEVAFARIWNEIKKVVFSNTLKKVEGNSILVHNDIEAVINQLKEQRGKHMSLGGATLAETFMNLGLIDEYHLYIHPILLGGGRRLFPSLRAKTNLKLIDSKVFDQTVVMLRYTPIKKHTKEEG